MLGASALRVIDVPHVVDRWCKSQFQRFDCDGARRFHPTRPEGKIDFNLVTILSKGALGTTL